LLRAALQYVHVPNYAALILRTDFQRLRLPGGLIQRSHEWLQGKAKWNGTTFSWHFPSGAILQFGYLSNSLDKYRYSSSEFQYIAFDELTEFIEDDYKFMFSRLRRLVNSDVPLRIRAATNPGGRGHEWVKARFITLEAERDLLAGTLKGAYFVTKDRCFVPSKIADNPAIDKEEYERSLMHLNPVERERLMNGDWSIYHTGLISSTWLRYYDENPINNATRLLKSYIAEDGKIVHTNEPIEEIYPYQFRRFMTIDTAGGVEDLEQENSGRKLSYTACGVWDTCNISGHNILVLRYVRRAKGLNYVGIKHLVANVIADWQPSKVYIENKAMGTALIADLSGDYYIEPLSPGINDKVVRAAPFLNMLENGRVYLPKHENTWRPEYESELLRWRGLKNETNDQIDISSYAAKVVQENIEMVIKAADNPIDVVYMANKAATPNLMGAVYDNSKDFGPSVTLMKGWI
jgi:phage terminase large subunit-like protein